MKLADFSSFFRHETDEAEERKVARAREALEWIGQAYHRHFVEWLDAEASRPFDLDKPDKIVQSAMRANTLREVQRYLKSVERESMRIQSEVRNGGT